MPATSPHELPPGQQLAAPGKWPVVGERASAVSDEPWRVEIVGQVQKPCLLSLEALRAMPQREQAIDIHCVTRWSKPSMAFRGVPLAALIEQAHPTAAARFVSFVARSERGHSTSLPLADALRLESIVAFEADGRPLPPEHGGPVRLVVPSRYFYKSLKWLTRIELLESDRLGYWESEAGYHNTADPWHEQRYLASTISKTAAQAILAQRDLQERDLRGLSAAGRDLAGLKAARAQLRDADFRRCDLSGASFDGANLSNAHFEAARLRGATFRHADLEGANFDGADLRGAVLLADSITAATFAGARLDASTQITPRTDRAINSLAAIPRAQRPAERKRALLMLIEDVSPLDVLVIAPHPDDAELGMAGAILRYKSEGYRVGILELTNGEPTPHGSVGATRPGDGRGHQDSRH